MTENDHVSKIESEAEALSNRLKSEGIEVLEIVCLVAYETPEGPGMVSLTTEEAPESLRSMMLTRALERNQK